MRLTKYLNHGYYNIVYTWIGNDSVYWSTCVMEKQLILVEVMVHVTKHYYSFIKLYSE